MSAADTELAQRSVARTRGFALVASKLNSDEDKTTTIYRRFDELSARNLLFYEAELAELEEQQKRQDAIDSDAKDPASVECQSDWSRFVEAAKSTDVANGREKDKMELAMKIRERLEKYHAALASHQALLNAKSPSKSTVQAMRNWFFSNTAGTPDGDRPPRLWGASETIFSNPQDLIALRVVADQDRLSSFVHSNLGVFFATSQPDGSQIYTSERGIARFVAIFSTILAAGLLFGAILSLRATSSEKAVLGMLCGWTVLFAACVGLLTNAKRAEIFGATAAYAAVLVVFVSGNLGTPSTSSGNVGNGTCVCRIT
ncbi:hypothetical protein N431DRAFT_423351 [Stipitochalara longipes BDJ]|nr:hypothetical protein N431DRAFT_423351 [Stipitochalara longipes BDJ]